MLTFFYSCFAFAFWRVAAIFGCKTRKPEVLTPDDGGDEELYHDGLSKVNGTVRRASQASSESVAEDSLPCFGPRVCLEADSDDDREGAVIVGNLNVTSQYSIQKKLVILTVVEATDVEDEQNGSQLQVRLFLVGSSPAKKHKTKPILGPTAKFGQTFTFPMEADELAVRRIRFRLYRFKSAVRPRQFRGECHLKTAEIDSRQPATHLLRFKMYPKLNANSRKKPHSPERTLSSPAELTPTMINRQGSVAVPGGPLGSATPSRRNSTVDSSGRFCALPTPNGQPEALISLCYLDQSEKIIVSVQKASNLDVEGSDTFVKVSVLSRYGEELAKHRSNSVKSASDTIFDCTAVFQIAKNELETSSVLIQIFRNAGMLRRRVQIGFVCVGENASSADAQTHWEQMIQGLGTSVEKWHNLQRPETTK